MCAYIYICIYIYSREFKSSFLRLHWKILIPIDMLNMKSLLPFLPCLPPLALIQTHIFAMPNFEMFKHESFDWVFLVGVSLGIQVYKCMWLCVQPSVFWATSIGVEECSHKNTCMCKCVTFSSSLEMLQLLKRVWSLLFQLFPWERSRAVALPSRPQCCAKPPCLPVYAAGRGLCFVSSCLV